MTIDPSVENWLHSVAFARLHVLADRGYRPMLSSRASSSDAIRLHHPRDRQHMGPPRLVLWSDGTIATSQLLWPKKYVPTETGSPDWQRFIVAEDEDAFRSFAQTIARPHWWRNWLQAPPIEPWRLAAAQLGMGAAACALIGLALHAVTAIFA